MAKKNFRSGNNRKSIQKVKTSAQIRLSQCMIVKNEEKNIEKALSWARNIAFEQIVVDTGSTDRTVEIAESLGAKVYHFEWINDFSAAKNFAIDQASGDWIAFLDADEYLSDKDAKKLIEILGIIERDPKLCNLKTAIISPCIQLDDNGQPFFYATQQRFFRNAPEIRYSGQIHEVLTINEQSIRVDEINVMHTGYSATAYTGTGKVHRNIELLSTALEQDPENLNLKCYLADSLVVRNDDGDIETADKLYREAITGGDSVLSGLKQGAYNHLIVKNYEDEEKSSELLELCKKAYEDFPENPDFCYYYGSKLFASGATTSAWEVFIKCEQLLKGSSFAERASHIIERPISLFYQMTLIADDTDNTAEVIRCATLVLKESKYEHSILAPYIQAFNRPGYSTSASDVYALLGKIYDLRNTRDKLTILQGAKAAGNADLVQIVLESFTKDELDLITRAQ